MFLTLTINRNSIKYLRALADQIVEYYYVSFNGVEKMYKI